MKFYYSDSNSYCNTSSQPLLRYRSYIVSSFPHQTPVRPSTRQSRSQDCTPSPSLARRAAGPRYRLRIVVPGAIGWPCDACHCWIIGLNISYARPEECVGNCRSVILFWALTYVGWPRASKPVRMSGSRSSGRIGEMSASKARRPRSTH